MFTEIGRSSDSFLLLVCEDNDADRVLIEEAVKACGYQCDLTLTSSQTEALLRLRTQEFELLLANFGTDFSEATMFLREVRSLAPSMPIVVLSGIGDPLPAYKAGANAFVHKALDFDDFFKKIRVLMAFWREVAARPLRNGASKSV